MVRSGSYKTPRHFSAVGKGHDGSPLKGFRGSGC